MKKLTNPLKKSNYYTPGLPNPPPYFQPKSKCVLNDSEWLETIFKQVFENYGIWHRFFLNEGFPNRGIISKIFHRLLSSHEASLGRRFRIQNYEETVTRDSPDEVLTLRVTTACPHIRTARIRSNKVSSHFIHPSVPFPCSQRMMSFEFVKWSHVCPDIISHSTIWLWNSWII